MPAGKLVSVFVGHERCGPMRSLPSARALAGCGLEGDRYFRPRDDGSARVREPDREVTLIELEAIEAVNRDAMLPLRADETRRNLVTAGVALNDLVGREFRVGGVTLKGIRLCDPCKHLQQMTRPGILKALLQRGGLRAAILSDGDLSVGDPVDVSAIPV